MIMIIASQGSILTPPPRRALASSTSNMMEDMGEIEDEEVLG